MNFCQKIIKNDRISSPKLVVAAVETYFLDFKNRSKIHPCYCFGDPFLCQKTANQVTEIPRRQKIFKKSSNSAIFSPFRCCSAPSGTNADSRAKSANIPQEKLAQNPPVATLVGNDGYPLETGKSASKTSAGIADRFPAGRQSSLSLRQPAIVSFSCRPLRLIFVYRIYISFNSCQFIILYMRL